MVLVGYLAYDVPLAVQFGPELEHDALGLLLLVLTGLLVFQYFGDAVFNVEYVADVTVGGGDGALPDVSFLLFVASISSLDHLYLSQE